MGSPNYGPMQGFMDQIGSAGKKAKELVSIPYDVLHAMLGMNQPQQPPVDPRIDAATDTFRHPMAQPPAPVVAPPRRKSMSGGEL